jgi:hypothetical protein
LEWVDIEKLSYLRYEHMGEVIQYSQLLKDVLKRSILSLDDLSIIVQDIPDWGKLEAYSEICPYIKHLPFNHIYTFLYSVDVQTLETLPAIVKKLQELTLVKHFDYSELNTISVMDNVKFQAFTKIVKYLKEPLWVGDGQFSFGTICDIMFQFDLLQLQQIPKKFEALQELTGESTFSSYE